MKTPGAVVFDAFGTLFDIRSLDAACERSFPGHGAELGRRWRDKQLRYTWLRSLMDRYENFERITADALAAVCRELHLDAGAAQGLAAGYLTLRAYPDVGEGLGTLSRSGYRLAILSNGTAVQLASLVANAGLAAPLEILSADAVRVYKPDPRVYALVADRLGVPAAETLFVSSNAWDVAGATAFGLDCAWLNRSHAAPEEIGPAPVWEGASLLQLAEDLGPR